MSFDTGECYDFNSDPPPSPVELPIFDKICSTFELTQEELLTLVLNEATMDKNSKVKPQRNDIVVFFSSPDIAYSFISFMDYLSNPLTAL